MYPGFVRQLADYAGASQDEMVHSTMKEALERLYARRTFGIKLGLDVEHALLGRMGNPEGNYAIIHVAGTNGKGSVCALLDSILRTAGYKVGLYTSPHLVRFNERMCVDGCPIGDDELGDLVGEIESLSDAVVGELGQEPTFFECATAIALEYFRRQVVQIAILETGMGGRLDATNVVMPFVSVITRISVEHSMYLGSDIETIALEKAGIIKEGRPVVCGAMNEEAFGVIKRVATEKRTLLAEADESVTIRVISRDLSGQKLNVETGDTSYGTMRFPLLGQHQVENLATAVAAIEVLNSVGTLNIRKDDIIAGISSVHWPGRCQVFRNDPPVIVDGAHNPGAAEALAGSLKQIFKGRPLGLVIGMCADKDVKSFLKPFSNLVKKLWVVLIKSDRSMPAAQISAVGKTMGWEVCETTLSVALDEAEDWAHNTGGAVCITGSLFLAGEVMQNVKEGANHVKK